MALHTLLEPLEINHMTLKNRIMFPPMTTGYEARDGSITEQSINFYKRVAEGGASYIVLGDVTPVHTISPTPKLVTDEQIPRSRRWPTRRNRRPRRSASPATAWSSPPARRLWPSTPARLRHTASRSRWSATATARPRTSTAPWRRATWPPSPPDTDCAFPQSLRTLEKHPPCHIQ